MTSVNPELTYKHNLNLGRHGWLRLTPAYSVKVVERLLGNLPSVSYILDPFSGTGTTGLVAAERGLRCDLVDINPFLIWFAQAKTRNYAEQDLQEAKLFVENIHELGLHLSDDDALWMPPIHNISRWWGERELNLIARIYRAISTHFSTTSNAKDLVLVAFCRLIIEASNAAFNHQSMSFKSAEIQQPLWVDFWDQELLNRFAFLTRQVLLSAQQHIPGHVSALKADSRKLSKLSQGQYDCVITSPPYPNRMSYIRELRPYMYWLGYLNKPYEAAELDWEAIGGTWGVATSRLKSWQPTDNAIHLSALDSILSDIATRSPLLANYVHRYFIDTLTHLRSLMPILSPGATVHYIVGNSKFYDTLVPVERIYASLLADVGFMDVNVEILRKRNSKKELFEYVISGRKFV